MQKFLRRLERFSQSLLSPLSYLSAAGLLLVLGALLTSKPLCQALPVLQWAPLQLMGQLLYNGMMVLINNLSVILCVGVAAVRAKTEKQDAALLALMAYLVFLTANHTALEALGLLTQPNGMTGLAGTGQTTILGIQVVDTGVASGIVLGFAAAWLFNRTCEKQFYGMITQLYSGLRWSFLWLSALAVALGLGFCFVCPPLQRAVSALTGWIAASGNAGVFLYGFLERLLIPTGLHHLIYMPFQFSSLGGSLTVGSVTYTGAYAVCMTEYTMGLPLSDGIVWMYTGFTKTFGYLGIAAAFIFTARKENRARTAAAMIPLAVTASVASITEPIDFSVLLRFAPALGGPCGHYGRLYGVAPCPACPGLHLQPAGVAGVQPERRGAAAEHAAALSAGLCGDPDLLCRVQHPHQSKESAHPGPGSRPLRRPVPVRRPAGGVPVHRRAGWAGEHRPAGKLLHPPPAHGAGCLAAGYGGSALPAP